MSTSEIASTESSYDEKVMKGIILKLLDKAGTDRRLTLRILRNKTEDKLKLDRGTLKEKRELIKTLTYKWWKVNQADTNGKSSSDTTKGSSSAATKTSSSTATNSAPSKQASESNEWKQLQSLAKAVGKSVFIKTLDESLNEKVKSNKLRRK